MSGQVVVISGASTGIGRACALHLDGLGLHVVAGVRRDADGEALQALSSPRLLPMRLDITDADGMATAATAITEFCDHAGGLLGVVNNAGVAVAGPLEFLTPDALRRQFEVNVFGQVQLTQHLLPLLRRDRGRIVFMSSLAGKVSQPMVGAYTASKHALEAIADAWRIELKPWGIEVSLVEPGAVTTPIWDKSGRAAAALFAEAPAALTSLYGAALEIAKAIAAREAETGVPPERVAAAVEAALLSPRPRTRYPVGRQAALGILARRVLPDRAFDALLLRLSGLPRYGDPTGPRHHDAREAVPEPMARATGRSRA